MPRPRLYLNVQWPAPVLFGTACVADGLEKVSVPVYIHSEVTDEAAKVAGKLLVDAKVKTNGPF